MTFLFASPAGKSRAARKGRSPRSGSGSRKTQKKPRKKRQTGAASGKKTLHQILPFLPLWLLAVVLLAGVVYWSRSTVPKISRESTNTVASLPKEKPPGRLEKSESRPRLPAEKSSKKKTPAENTRLASKHPAVAGKESRAASVSPPKKLPIPKPELKPPIAEAAIVIDDFGRDMEMAKKFLELPLPITFSVIPFLPHSKEIAELAHAKGHEVILHLPMEPQGYPKVDPGRGALFTFMSPEKIRATLKTALDAYPRISGINNHMGSKFTQDDRGMRIVLEELRKRGLFFLDSYTTDKSVGYSLAEKMNIACSRRDIFLDHTASEDFVRSQIRQLIRRAKVQGKAIAIGHPHPYTYNVLRRESGLFRREGIVIVPLGRLMKRNGRR